MTGSGHGAESASVHSAQPGVSRAESILRRTTSQRRSAGRLTRLSGDELIRIVSARIDRTARRAPMTTSPSGASFTQAYMRTRRRRKAPYRREDVFTRWGGRCVYCEAPAEHLDHVQPLSRGGRDLLSNVVPACAACNLDKGARSLTEWVESWEAFDTTEAQQQQLTTPGER